jgi:heme exporter protein B
MRSTRHVSTLGTWRVAKLVAAKDLRIELRSRVMFNRVLPFAGLVMVMFAFALGAESILERVAPGLVWLAVVFSLFMTVQRSFAVETADGALDALRVADVDSAGIFLGKAAALAVQLLVLETLLVVTAILVYRAELSGAGFVLFVTTAVTATLGLAAVGTLYGGLTAGARGRETLLPLLVLPVVAPVLIGATRATEAAFGTAGVALEEGWPWLALLGTFAMAFVIVGTLAFGALIDE